MTNPFGPWLPNREIALLLGAKTYYTGEPCKHGHVCLRLVSGRICLECQKRSMRAYRATERGKEKGREHARKTYAKLAKQRPPRPPAKGRSEASYAKMREAHAKYRLDPNNQEKIKSAEAQYYKDHKAYVLQRSSERRRKNKEFDNFMKRLEAGEDVYGVRKPPEV
jgi:hypothetical protein